MGDDVIQTFFQITLLSTDKQRQKKQARARISSRSTSLRDISQLYISPLCAKTYFHSIDISTVLVDIGNHYIDHAAVQHITGHQRIVVGNDYILVYKLKLAKVKAVICVDTTV